MFPTAPIPPKILTPKIRLHPRQYEVFHCPTRFRVLVAGRRFGKTELALAEILRAAERPNSLIWYVGPTERFAKRQIWRPLKKLTRDQWAEKPTEESLCIELTNGTLISVRGSYDPDDLRGGGLDFVVLDEVADLKPEAWQEILRPSLTDRKGRALFIGTPKGRNHFFDYFELSKTNPNWASFQFTTEEGGIVEKSELEDAGHEMDANLFRQEFDAQFTSIGKYRVYLSFERESNVREVRFDPKYPLIWALDFNVDPMCMLLMQKINDDINVLEEIVVRSNTGTTEQACRAFASRAEIYAKSIAFMHGPLDVHVYGDASGNQRRTAASATDWTIIRDFFRSFYTRLIELSCRFATTNPLVRDRVNCVNARLRNKYGESRLFISPACKELIRDLEEVCWSVDSTGLPTREIDKKDPARTHMSDALGYYVSQIFPLRGFTK